MAREAEAAQIMLKLPYMAVAAYNSRVDWAYFTLVGRSGIYTHGWFHSIYKKSREKKDLNVLSMNLCSFSISLVPLN